MADPTKAVEILGAIQNETIERRIANARTLGETIVDSHMMAHPQFQNAHVHTPLLLKLDASDESKFMQELFGPIAFVIATDDTGHSIELAERGAIEHGAITMSVYSTDKAVLEQARDAAADAGVALSCNLTDGVFVNQSAAYSDFHASGANPAANASLTDTAFVANRFRVAQSRAHV